MSPVFGAHFKHIALLDCCKMSCVAGLGQHAWSAHRRQEEHPVAWSAGVHMLSQDVGGECVCGQKTILKNVVERPVLNCLAYLCGEVHQR
jgi:hypothetical protein